MRKITTKNSELFFNKMKTELEKLGAVNDLSYYKCFKLNTIGGPLLLTVDEDNVYCFTVTTRFLEVHEAKEAGIISTDCFSGKWNHHIATLKPLEAIEEIKQSLLKIVA